jgi:hypothetical protein
LRFVLVLELADAIRLIAGSGYFLQNEGLIETLLREFHGNGSFAIHAGR